MNKVPHHAALCLRRARLGKQYFSVETEQVNEHWRCLNYRLMGWFYYNFTHFEVILLQYYCLILSLNHKNQTHA